MSERTVAAAFVVATLAALGLGLTYVLGGQAQWEGALLGAALGGIGLGLSGWSKRLFAVDEEADERPVLVSGREPRREFLSALERGEHDVGRRRLLVRLLGLAVGALGLAALFPLRSLGPSPGDALRRTAWRAGARATLDGDRLVRAADLEVGSVLTVFPEGAPDAEDSATLLIRVEPGELQLRPGRESWAPDGIVAYSKICTHVGCPVGLYQRATQQLLCPCHQSTFDVLHGARPVFGPATRSLPQLPLRIDEDGFVVADGDFPEPIGPGFWDRGR
jgi:ubiquinol-cytochrome c reductase iron-sulfur subunit